MFLSLLLIIGVAPVLALIGLWMFYLSLVSVGQSFLSFQWDALLLETGFLAIFFRAAPDSAGNLAGISALVCRVMAAPLAAVSADVRVRRREVVERRFDVE